MAGIPPGLIDAVVSVLTTTDRPWRRRDLLGELERRGHRVSLAGLNRTLQRCAETGLTVEGPDGVRSSRRP